MKHLPSRAFSAQSYAVLYVDDEPDNLLVFRSNLADDFSILTCQTAEEALKLLDEEPIALVLTDQRMPGMTGVDLCERVREQHPAVRRLLMTAYSDQQTAVDAINRGGVHGFLVKPWSDAELRRVLLAELERVHLAQELTRLRALIQEHEHQLQVASVRARLLHDVGNVTLRLNLSFRKLADLLLAPEREVLAGQDLVKARGSSEKLKAAIEHLVALHQTQRAAQEAQHPEEVGAMEAAESAQALCGLDQAARIRTHLTVASGAAAWADRISLTRILVNLLTNAAQAIERDGGRGHIHLDARPEHGFLVVDVTDTGPGVPALLRDRIFDERFTTREAHGGSGLGLCSARALALANGGTLELLTTPGRGACFRLRLPLRAPAEAASTLAC